MSSSLWTGPRRCWPFLHQSMPRLDLYGTVDAAICCLDSLNYLTNPRDVQRTFQRLHLFISPGGLLAFDVRLPEWLAALDGQVFLDETEDTYCVWRTEYRRGLCTYYMDLFTLAEDGSWDRSFELHRQRGYSVEQLTRWLEEATAWCRPRPSAAGSLPSGHGRSITPARWPRRPWAGLWPARP